MNELRVSPAWDSPLHRMPQKAHVEAYFHIHLAVDGLTSNENFSKGNGEDRDNFSAGKIDWYLFTMNGNLKVARRWENTPMDLLLATRNSQGLIDINPYKQNFRINGVGLQDDSQLAPVYYLP